MKLTVWDDPLAVRNGRPSAFLPRGTYHAKLIRPLSRLAGHRDRRAAAPTTTGFRASSFSSTTPTRSRWLLTSGRPTSRPSWRANTPTWQGESSMKSLRSSTVCSTLPRRPNTTPGHRRRSLANRRSRKTWTARSRLSPSFTTHCSVVWLKRGPVCPGLRCPLRFMPSRLTRCQETRGRVKRITQALAGLERESATSQ